MPQYSVVLFDVGGTLVESEPPAKDILMRELDTLGISFSAEQAKKAWAEVREWELSHIICKLQGAPWMPEAEFKQNFARVAIESLCADRSAADRADLCRRYMELPKSKREWVPIEAGVFPMLEEIKARGYRLGIVSNWGSELHDLLISLGFAAYFEEIVISGVVGMEKPDPRILPYACENMAVEPSDCLYIGDHPIDVLCSNRAGIDVVYIENPNQVLPMALGAKPTIRINRTVDILEYLPSK